MIGLNAFPAFVRDDGQRPWLSDLLDHADHISRLAGPGALGLGLDFIEAWTDVEKRNLRAHPQAFGTQYDFPIGLDGVAQLPNLTRGLVARGYDDAAIRGILGGNYVELFRRSWRPARASVDRS